MFKPVIKKIKEVTEKKEVLVIFLTFLIAFNFLVWGAVFEVERKESLEVYFLDVGQGDSQLLRLHNEVDILIDGGPPNGEAARKISDILDFEDRYIDLISLTHPQSDHAGGLVEILKFYNSGAFLHSGRKSKGKFLRDLEKQIKQNNLLDITLSAGDVIKYKDFKIEVIAPKKSFLKFPDPNNSSLVLRLIKDDFSLLLPGDITQKVEKKIAPKIKETKVLKVAHHGSQYSSHSSFLKKAKPEISVIQVGNNSYGHPSNQSLKRLAAVGSSILRTDKDGTVKLELSQGGKLKVYTQK